MQPHQERVVAERSELADKVTKLAAFGDTDVFRALPEGERWALVAQLGHMRGYLAALDSRLAIWGVA